MSLNQIMKTPTTRKNIHRRVFVGFLTYRKNKTATTRDKASIPMGSIVSYPFIWLCESYIKFQFARFIATYLQGEIYSAQAAKPALLGSRREFQPYRLC